ncbi:hypothetical protein F503_06577 [Ophiostoma piceae UAMH 11346]|uniref:Uncharacterized protein n=1 Tax=Ophiostoma piceae (strain UAMH 11346) TaxID=1262450 RepID=S3BT66_OPHP1|nr:hypothetical protein F503_06577 [Ophiostoma piceae UAMH 11346]
MLEMLYLAGFRPVLFIAVALLEQLAGKWASARGSRHSKYSFCSSERPPREDAYDLRVNRSPLFSRARYSDEVEFIFLKNIHPQVRWAIDPQVCILRQEASQLGTVLDIGPLCASENADPATDFSMLASINQLGMFYGLQVSDLLEAASIRHCLIADVLTEALGSDNMVGDTFVAVCDDQLAVAGALLSATGMFLDAEPTFYDDATTDDRFPGFVFAGKEVDVETNPCRIMIVPASYWHIKLDTDNYARNTVLLSEPRCRFPNKLHYMDALIDMIAARTRKPKESNGSISTYLDCQLLNFMACVPKSLVARLPLEDRLFLELFYKVLLPSARVKLCVEYDKIRRGETTVDEARTRIPRKDLALNKIKARYQARMKAADAAGKEGQK